MQKHLDRMIGIICASLLAGACNGTNDTPGSIQRSDLGDAWPFAVDRGAISCVGAGEVLFSTDGVVYAVNGLAKTNRAQKGYREVAEIWRENPAIPGTKINIGPIIDRGLALCPK